VSRLLRKDNVPVVDKFFGTEVPKAGIVQSSSYVLLAGEGKKLQLG